MEFGGVIRYDQVTINGVIYKESTIDEVIAAREILAETDRYSNVARYSTDFVVYARHDEGFYFEGEDRAVILNEDTITFSDPNERNRFSVGFLDFIRNHPFAYPNRAYLQASGLYDYVLRDLEFVGVTDETAGVLGRLPSIRRARGELLNHFSETDRGCLLYTSPSPRDS